jgi:4-amino-4-deoxy-L-arabinose transferase-like glycosyltransferase
MNLKFTAWPEMLLWPYMMIQGLLPYKDIAIAHTPHLVIDLAIFFKIFGVGVLQLKIYTWLLIIFTDLVVYWVSNKLWNRKVAIVSTFSFVILQIFFDGNGLWFDSLLAPFSVLLFYLVSKKNYLWTGIVWAVMFLTKQTAVWFLLPIAWQVAKNEERKMKNLIKYVYGVSIVLGSFLLLLFTFNLLPSFYTWAVNFGIFILPGAQGQIQLPDLKNLIVAGFPFVVFVPFLLNKKNRNLNLLAWVIAGVMGTYPRFEYFHFQPAIPFLAIIIAIVVTGVKQNKLIKAFLIFYTLGSVYLFANYFMRNWREGTRFLEADVVDVVSYVRNNTHENEKIFVLNWWDNIYPLTGTLPATDPWVPQLPWYQDLPGVQEKEVENLRATKPKLILFKEYEQVGLAAYKPQKVLDFINSNYTLKEEIDNIGIFVLR